MTEAKTSNHEKAPICAAFVKEMRELFGDDNPKGMYYFDSRNKPISTVQSGNMQLIMNPNGAPNAGAVVLVGYEAFAQVNTIVGAASLAGGGQ